MNSVFKKDLYRYYGERGEPLLKKVFRPLEIKYISVFRKLSTNIILHIKITLKWTTDLYMQATIIKLQK